MKKNLSWLLGFAIAVSFSESAWALNYATATGADIVRECWAKKRGYSSAQKQMLRENLKGRILTFENGKISSVYKQSGYIQVDISFSDPNDSGIWNTFYVDARVTDPQAMAIAVDYDEGLEIAMVRGKVSDRGYGFVLTDAELFPKGCKLPPPPAVNAAPPPAVNASPAVGQPGVVNGNAAMAISQTRRETDRTTVDGTKVSYTSEKVESNSVRAKIGGSGYGGFFDEPQQDDAPETRMDAEIRRVKEKAARMRSGAQQ